MWIFVVVIIAAICIVDSFRTLSKLSENRSLQWAWVRTAILFVIFSGIVFFKIGFDIGAM
jgi:hypothetical protein